MNIARKISCYCLVLAFCLLISSHNIASGYGYAKEEDPLIRVFRAIILYGRLDNWPKVAAEVNSIGDRFADINKIFNIDFKTRIDHTIRQQDFQSLANQLANFIFLAIREKFYYNRQEQLEIFFRAKVRLRLAEEYYVALLSGNVRDYDVRHKTNLHEAIYNKFIKAREALGSTGFLGAGSVKPNVKEFNLLAKEIEVLLLKAFPYFETGVSGHQ